MEKCISTTDTNFTNVANNKLFAGSTEVVGVMSLSNIVSPNKTNFDNEILSKINNFTQRNAPNFIIIGADKIESKLSPDPTDGKSDKQFSSSLIFKNKKFAKINFSKLNSKKTTERQQLKEFNTILMPEVQMPPLRKISNEKLNKIRKKVDLNKSADFLK